MAVHKLSTVSITKSGKKIYEVPSMAAHKLPLVAVHDFFRIPITKSGKKIMNCHRWQFINFSQFQLLNAAKKNLLTAIDGKIFWILCKSWILAKDSLYDC